VILLLGSFDQVFGLTKVIARLLELIGAELIFGELCQIENADAILDHCCNAWNKLEAQPWTIMSLGMRDWALRF
jgi:hypothetical protein